MKKTLALDLDGTIAQYHGFKENYVGDPIHSVIQAALKRQAEGWEIVIFTARAEEGHNCTYITTWLVENGFKADTYITNIKHKYFTEFWDDRAVGIIRNMGFDPSVEGYPEGEPSAVRQILTKAADIYDDRNNEYGDAYKRVHAQVMSALFPDGITLKGRDSFIRFCLVNAIIGKIARYTTMFNEGGHEDSAMDGAAYMAMLKELDDEIGKRKL